MAKTFEHASRADAQSVNPLYLCIVGGLALPENERGPLDTEVTPNSPFHAHDLLRPLDPRDVDDVFEQGVIAPIEVVRVNDIPTVNWGRGRVRKARLANIRRQSEGLPPIEVKFVVVRISNGLQLIKRAHAENLRRKTFGVLDQIELAKQLLLHGASEESAATQSQIPQSRFKQVMEFEDSASPTVKEALRQDRLSVSAAFVLAAIEGHTEQDAKLAGFLSAPKPTVRAARQAEQADRGCSAATSHAEEAPPACRQAREGERLDAGGKGGSLLGPGWHLAQGSRQAPRQCGGRANRYGKEAVRVSVTPKEREDWFVAQLRKESGGVLSWESELLLRHGFAAGANELSRVAYTAGIEAQQAAVLDVLGAVARRESALP